MRCAIWVCGRSSPAPPADLALGSLEPPGPAWLHQMSPLQHGRNNAWEGRYHVNARKRSQDARAVAALRMASTQEKQTRSGYRRCGWHPRSHSLHISSCPRPIHHWLGVQRSRAPAQWPPLQWLRSCPGRTCRGRHLQQHWHDPMVEGEVTLDLGVVCRTHITQYTSLRQLQLLHLTSLPCSNSPPIQHTSHMTHHRRSVQKDENLPSACSLLQVVRQCDVQQEV